MKRLLPIFELTRNEQRVVLIVTFVLLAFAFIRYERRVHKSPGERTQSKELQPSPSPVEVEDEHQR